MPENHAERIAVLEQIARELPDDLAGIRSEQERARQRLHTLEATAQALVVTQKEARRAEDTQYRRLELRFQWLAVAVSLAGLVLALAVTFAHH